MHVCNKDIFTFFKMDPIKLSISDYVNILQQNVRKQEYTKHFDGYLHNTKQKKNVKKKKSQKIESHKSQGATTKQK